MIYYEIGYTSDRFGRLSPTCVARRGVYRQFAPLWNMVWYVLLPALLMFIFGLLTISNIRQSQRHVRSHNEQNIAQLRRNGINNQLLVQVITILFTVAPFSIYRIRASLTSNTVKNQYELAQDNLFLQTATVVSLISVHIIGYHFSS